MDEVTKMYVKYYYLTEKFDYDLGGKLSKSGEIKLLTRHHLEMSNRYALQLRKQLKMPHFKTYTGSRIADMSFCKLEQLYKEHIEPIEDKSKLLTLCREDLPPL